VQDTVGTIVPAARYRATQTPDAQVAPASGQAVGREGVAAARTKRANNRPTIRLNSANTRAVKRPTIGSELGEHEGCNSANDRHELGEHEAVNSANTSAVQLGEYVGRELGEYVGHELGELTSANELGEHVRP
jgi:hypothetical protein